MTSDAASTSEPDPHADPSPTASTDPDDATEPPVPARPAAPTEPTVRGRHTRARTTRTGYTWIALVAAAVIGIVLLIFILQNLTQARVTLFFWHFSLPLGVTILLSLIAGTLVMALVGGWRMLQLRRAARKR